MNDHAHASDLALVESPLQFITAIEALKDSPAAVIHWREDAKGMAAFMDAFRPEWLPAGVTTHAGMPDLRTQFEGRILVGDLCSGRIQKQLTDGYFARYLPPITILDDGLSTVAVVRQLMQSAQPLQRPRTAVSPLRLPLSAFVTSRLRGLARKGRLTWFTALITDRPMLDRVRATGLHVETHGFEYVRALEAAESPPTRTVIIGSAMAADGLIDESAYRAWIESAAEEAPLTYYPHRREDARFLSALAHDSRIHVKEAGLPLELRLSSLTHGTRIKSLPSTAAFSLALLNCEADITVTAVPPSWWLPAAPQAFRISAHTTAEDLGSHGLTPGQ